MRPKKFTTSMYNICYPASVLKFDQAYSIVLQIHELVINKINIMKPDLTEAFTIIHLLMSKYVFCCEKVVASLSGAFL